MAETTDNAFLGGQLQLLQPRRGYRAGIDPVLLAAACEPPRAARVMELGCGVGAALLCLGRRRPDLWLTGVERLALHADLARENAARNGIEARIVTADLADLPKTLRQESFDLILANPPFFDRAASTAAMGESREEGRGQDTPLAVWTEVAARRLVPRGQAVFVLRADMVADAMVALAGRLGSLEILPFAPRAGRDAKLVILKAVKGGRAAMRLRAPIVLHRGATHGCDGEDYTDSVAAILRQGLGLADLSHEG